MMILVYAVIYASGQAAIGSTVRSFGALWGRSILGEYDRTLKERYGIFAFYADPLLAEHKLNLYADYTCRGKSYLHQQGAAATLDGFGITESDIFERQIRAAVLSCVKPQPLPAPQAQRPIGGSAVAGFWIACRLQRVAEVWI